MIDLSNRFAELDTELITLLKSLSKEEWNKQTIAKLWTVKDVAAHLLDGNIRVLSGLRDRHQAPAPVIHSYQGLVDYLNQLNAEWVAAMKRVSPEMIIGLLEQTGPQYSTFYASLDLFDKSAYSVAWAGESDSKNWMHIAREYTEKFLHQQQIRDAVGQPGLMTKHFFHPFLDVCMYALPHTLRNTTAKEGDTIKIEITGGAGGTWYTQYNGHDWVRIDPSQGESPTTKITIDQDTSWKLFSKSLRPNDVIEKINLAGNQEIGRAAIEMVSFMA